MENILSNNLSYLELLPYFSVEIMCLIGVIINISMYLFVPRKYNLKRLSDLTTFIFFSVNSLILGTLLLRNNVIFGDFEFSAFNNSIIYNNQNILLSFWLNVFFAIFILCTYKTTSKTRFKMPIANSCLLFLGLFSNTIIHIQNSILAFILLDVCIFFIYKFASNTRIKKLDIFLFNFILINSISTFLFYTFYTFSNIFKEELQLAVMQVCMTIMLLLKTGLFPFFNYSIIKTKKNIITYSILLFTLLPFLGINIFSKFASIINFSNEIYFISTVAFILVFVFCAGLCAFKVKNLVSFLANCSYIYTGLYLISILFKVDHNTCLNSALISMFIILNAFLILCILRINIKSKKLDLNLIKGIFIKNRKFALLFSLSILMIANILPNIAFKNNLLLIKEIYEFDQLSFWAVLVFLFANMLVTLNSFNVIGTIYSSRSQIELTKRTMLNYIVPYVIIISLIIMIFL